jgi:hypothetical protein
MECQLNEAHFPNLSEILASMDTNNDGQGCVEPAVLTLREYCFSNHFEPPLS